MFPMSLTYSIRPKALHVHLGGLFSQRRLVGHDSLDDLGVEEDDGAHWHDIVAGEGVQDEAPVAPVLTQVVIGAGDEKTL